MLELQGTIEEIVQENNNGHDKLVVTLQAGRNNKVFIEFQGKYRKLLDGYSEGQRVEIRVRFNGKVSKLGRRYNNIIAKSIQHI